VKKKVSKITGPEGVMGTVRKNIHRELSRGMEAGESIDQLADRVKSVFKVAKTRAKTIARTEVVGASNKGRSEALKESGFKKKKWFTAMDENVRETHVEMGSSKAIPVEDDWELPSGEMIAHPGDYSGPPEEIINCRCIEVPVEK